MKKTIIAILTTIALLSTTANAAPVTGGWTCTTDSTITEEAQSVFNKAMEGLVGVNYEPVDLLATQVVAGLNYCFLCRTSPVIPDSIPGYALVYIYEDLQGNAEILDTQEISFGVRPVYDITIGPNSEKDMIYDCPDSARAGETVTVQIMFVTDADIYVSINGDEDYGSFTSEGYEFTMPEEDVVIEAWAVGNGLA